MPGRWCPSAPNAMTSAYRVLPVHSRSATSATGRTSAGVPTKSRRSCQGAGSSATPAAPTGRRRALLHARLIPRGARQYGQALACRSESGRPRYGSPGRSPSGEVTFRRGSWRDWRGLNINAGRFDRQASKVRRTNPSAAHSAPPWAAHWIWAALDRGRRTPAVRRCGARATVFRGAGSSAPDRRNRCRSSVAPGRFAVASRGGASAGRGARDRTCARDGAAHASRVMARPPGSGFRPRRSSSAERSMRSRELPCRLPPYPMLNDS